MKIDRLAIVKATLLATVVLTTLAGEAFVRPETTRLPLQSPLSERVITLWREGVVTLGETVHEDDWSAMPYEAQQAWGLRLVIGSNRALPDWKSAAWTVNDEAVPEGVLTFRQGMADFVLAVASPFGRAESVYGKLTVCNRGSNAEGVDFGLLLRTGKEKSLIKGTPDLYAFYDPDASLENWRALSPTWVSCGRSLCRDGKAFFRFGGELPGVWDATNGVCRFQSSLSPGETRSVEFVFGLGSVEPLGFAAARKRLFDAWRLELARAKDRSPLMKRLIVQMLQSFARPTEGEFVLPRQGGQQRYVWPGETVLVAEALERLGYGEYARFASDFVLRFAKEDGCVGPFGNGWASDTAYSLTIFAQYCTSSKDAAYWRRHRDTAEKAVDWIAAKRVVPGDSSGNVPGLFPAMKSTDFKQIFQNWSCTDIRNEVALRETARASELFGDNAFAAKCRALEADYRRVLSSLMDGWRAKSAGTDVFYIPFTPDGRMERELRAAHYFFLHPGEFAAEGYVKAEELERCRRWLLNERQACEEGLYLRLVSPRPELGEHIWYTTWSEYRWCTAWLRAGRRDRAEQALDALLKYSITAEGLVGERIHETNRWFWPWSPNASGAARIAMMMLDLGKERE